MQTKTGMIEHYQITAIMILHESDTTSLLNTNVPTLTLITCYPFDAIVAGGPLRYVVIAESEQMITEA